MSLHALQMISTRQFAHKYFDFRNKLFQMGTYQPAKSNEWKFEVIIHQYDYMTNTIFVTKYEGPMQYQLNNSDLLSNCWKQILSFHVYNVCGMSKVSSAWMSNLQTWLCCYCGTTSTKKLQQREIAFCLICRESIKLTNTGLSSMM